MNIDFDMRDALAVMNNDHAVFTVPESIASALTEGTDYVRIGSGHDWTAEGYAALRQAGWSGEVRTLPEVADVIGRIASAIPRPAAPAPIAPAPVASPRPTAPSTALPSRPVAPATAKASAPTAALDVKRILARSQHGDVAFAKMAGATAQEADLAGASSMTDFAARFWSRHRCRVAAGQCPRTGKTRGAPTAARAAVRTEARLENRLPDASAVFAQRRGPRSAA